jgi:hypothetical protein
MAKSGLMGGGQFGQNLGQMFSRGPGGLLPARGSQPQYDMVQSLLQGGMGAAAQSGSPLLALLAPMVGGAIGNRTQGLYDEAQKARRQKSTQGLLELMGGDPKAAGILEILGDQDAPDHVRSIASSMMGKVLNPPRGRKPAGRKMREDVNGLLRYLDTGEQVFEGVTRDPSNRNTGDWRQINSATELVQNAVSDLVNYDGLSREEALETVRNDPRYAPQWAMIEIGSSISAPSVTTPVVPQTDLAKPNSPARSAPPPPPPGTVEF